MKRILIAIDTWKLPIFERHLREAGYEWTRLRPTPRGATYLKVKAQFASDVQKIVEAAQKEASNAKQ